MFRAKMALWDYMYFGYELYSHTRVATENTGNLNSDHETCTPRSFVLNHVRWLTVFHRSIPSVSKIHMFLRLG
jgi:hypothetical protein